MDARDDLMMRKTMAPVNVDGIGIKASAMAEGKWVKTIVLTSPILFDKDAATTDEMADKMAIIEKIVPSEPVGKENLV